jgi:hypothetical protein
MAMRLSALQAGSSLPTMKIADTHFCWRMSQPQENLGKLNKFSDFIGKITATYNRVLLSDNYYCCQLSAECSI